MSHYEAIKTPEICGTCIHWRANYDFEHSGKCVVNDNRRTFYYDSCSYD